MTVEEAIEEFRVQIKDTADTPRWDDETVIQFLNHAVRDINRLRPDAFFTDAGLQPLVKLSSGDTLPVNHFFEEAAVYYMCYRALVRDSDDPAAAQQAGYYLQLFNRSIS